MTVLFNGIAYGVLLFIMSVGLSVTMGMMNFVNLAQASFSMFGGYVVVMVTQQFGLRFSRVFRSLSSWSDCSRS